MHDNAEYTGGYAIVGIKPRFRTACLSTDYVMFRNEYRRSRSHGSAGHIQKKRVCATYCWCVLLLATPWNTDPQPAVTYQRNRRRPPLGRRARSGRGRRGGDALRLRGGEAAGGRRGRRRLLGGRGRLVVAGEGVREGEAAEWVGRLLLLLGSRGGLAEWGRSVRIRGGMGLRRGGRAYGACRSGRTEKQATLRKEVINRLKRKHKGDNARAGPRARNR